MDYSASVHDAEHPAEASPWGNSPGSSPRHNRTTFGAITSEPPTSPFGYPAQNPQDALTDDGGFGATDSGFRRPDTASTISAAESLPEEGFRSEDAVHSQQQGQENQGFATGDQGPLPPAPQQPGEPPRDFAQQQAQQQQGQQHQQLARRPQPQYKLQAKITGLERTGRKDPILRFDVHV
jgi:hypothetical protein